MRRELVDGVLNDGHVHITTYDQVVAVIRLLEAHSLQNDQTAVHLGYASLHSRVVQVDFPELLIGGVFLDVFHERVDCLEAGLGDSRGPKLRVERLHGLDAVLDQLGRRLLVLFLFGTGPSGSSEPLPAVPF